MADHSSRIKNIIKINSKLILEINRKRKLYNIDKIDMEQLAVEYKEASETRKSEIEDIMLAYNLPLVISIINKWYDLLSSEDSIQDIMSHLMLSMISILKRYKPNDKNKFSTYLVASLNGEALKFMDNDRIVKYNYYYLVKKKGQEPLVIGTESSIQSLLDEEENALEIYSKYYSSKNTIPDEVEDDTERKKKEVLHELFEKLKQFIESDSASELDKSIMMAYINSLISIDENYTVNQIAEYHNVNKDYIYKVIRRTFKKFRDLCSQTGSELNKLYDTFIEITNEKQ